MTKRLLCAGVLWNLCFADFDQKPVYEDGKGTIVNFEHVPLLSTLRENISKLAKRPNLYAESNYYYDPKTCGIGYHGDTERRIVIGARLGQKTPLVFQWYHKFSRIGDPIPINLEHGDIYIMSDKATGNDWKSSSKYTLRHAAGCGKYTR